MKTKKISVAAFVAIVVFIVVWLIVNYFSSSKQVYEGTLVKNQIEEIARNVC